MQIRIADEAWNYDIDQWQIKKRYCLQFCILVLAFKIEISKNIVIFAVQITVWVLHSFASFQPIFLGLTQVKFLQTIDLLTYIKNLPEIWRISKKNTI